MKYTDKNRRNIVIASLIVWVSLIGASITLFYLVIGANTSKNANALTATTTAKKATISPAVFDGLTNQPIEGAVVVVVETGNSYTTDATGKTKYIEVPVIHDTRFDGILPKQWGEITLIVYKDGYKPYALFYLQVYAEENRSGPSIFMFEEKNTSEEPFSIIESPNRLWVESLIQKFKK